MPATVAYTVEIELGLGDLPRNLQRLSVCVGACNLLRHRLGQRRERDVRHDWDIQPMAQCVLCGASFTRRVFGPVLDFALIRLARRRPSLVKMVFLRLLLPFRRLRIQNPEFHRSLVA